MPSRMRCTLAVWFAVAAAVTGPAVAQFQSHNVSLYAQLDLFTLGGNNGNDCWGYVSPSGREYALMGVSGAVVVVEITNPASPVIVERIPHGSSFTGDLKTYQHYIYAVNESGSNDGLQIIDLQNVDAGVVTLVNSARPDNFGRAHNIALNPDSGFAYPCATNITSGLVALDLTNPVDPVSRGTWRPTGGHVHDLQVVNYTMGPYAGREIAFCCCGGLGLYIVDVTNKANMTQLSSRTYPGLGYCHQGWLTEDRRYFLVNDEFDEQQGATPTTRTLVFDVQDLQNPSLATTFTSGQPSTDHNLYTHLGFVFEANYTSGLRIFDIADPLNAVQTGWIDTHPASNAPGYEGAWSTYPYFPSGTVIVSDIEQGLFILDVSAAVQRPVVCMKGDVNDDGERDGLDVGPFVETFVSGGTPGTVAFCAADMNDDGALTAADDAPLFVACLVDGVCP